jgi:hypothetical protein
MSAYDPTPQQEKAIREYLHESIVPLIEQVLVKKLGQAMSYAAQELVNPKREWQGLTDEEMHACWDSPLTPLGMKHARMIEAELKRKNT